MLKNVVSVCSSAGFGSQPECWDATSTAVPVTSGLVAILNLTESATVRGRDREGPFPKQIPIYTFISLIHPGNHLCIGLNKAVCSQTGVVWDGGFVLVCLREREMSTLTQRSSGLVQRRTEASRSAAAADRERGSGDEDYEPRRGEEPEDDDSGDSKETRLTLMEEVLLLGLKDREVIVVLLYFLSCCFYSRCLTLACYPSLSSTIVAHFDAD